MDFGKGKVSASKTIRVRESRNRLGRWKKIIYNGGGGGDKDKENQRREKESKKEENCKEKK